MISTKMAFRALSMVLILQTVLADPINRRKEIQELRKLQQQCANLLQIHGNYFLLEETRNISGIPADMHVHWKSGDLYFTVLGGGEMMAEHVINKQTGLQKKINVVGGQSTAIDNTNNVVYIATENGVYRQKENGSPEFYAASEDDVMYLTVTKDGSVLYIATYPKYQVFKITQDGKNEEIMSAIPFGSGLTVDPKGNIFFGNDNETAYVLQAGQSVPVKIEGVPNEKILDFSVVKGDDDIFAMDQDSNLYHLDGQAALATNWGSFGLTANTFALDGAHNVYIGVDGAIKKFKHYDENPCNEV